jgi:hypothetical protein
VGSTVRSALVPRCALPKKSTKPARPPHAIGAHGEVGVAVAVEVADAGDGLGHGHALRLRGQRGALGGGERVGAAPDNLGGVGRGIGDDEVDEAVGVEVARDGEVGGVLTARSGEGDGPALSHGEGVAAAARAHRVEVDADIAVGAVGALGGAADGEFGYAVAVEIEQAAPGPTGAAGAVARARGRPGDAAREAYTLRPHLDGRTARGAGTCRSANGRSPWSRRRAEYTPVLTQEVCAHTQSRAPAVPPVRCTTSSGRAEVHTWP